MLHRMAMKKREEIMWTTKQKIERRHRKGGSQLEQESTRQKTMEGIGGGPHPAVSEQSQSERRESCDTYI